MRQYRLHRRRRRPPTLRRRRLHRRRPRDRPPPPHHPCFLRQWGNSAVAFCFHCAQSLATALAMF